MSTSPLHLNHCACVRVPVSVCCVLCVHVCVHVYMYVCAYVCLCVPVVSVSCVYVSVHVKNCLDMNAHVDL